MDYTIYCAELQSVDPTAAPTADSFQQEVDATSATLLGRKLPSVGAAEASMNESFNETVIQISG
jgi:hypothetical protein